MHIRWWQQILPVLPNPSLYLVAGCVSAVPTSVKGYSTASRWRRYDWLLTVFRTRCTERPYVHSILHGDRGLPLPHQFYVRSVAGLRRQNESAVTKHRNCSTAGQVEETGFNNAFGSG